ncbi:hypothetical protein AN1V17_19750 [Vallitalea sediminicola]
MKRKINMVDIILIIILIVVIAGSYFYFTKDDKEENFKIGKEKVTFIVEGDNVLPELSNKIAIEDKLMANGIYQDAVVTKVEVVDHEEVIAVDGVIKAIKYPTLKRVIITIEANVNRYGPYMDIGGQELKSSTNFWFKTDKMTLLGKVVNIL